MHNAIQTGIATSAANLTNQRATHAMTDTRSKPVQKAIIINSMGRSGSNLLWNLLQSSPDVVSPGKEFHELFGVTGWRRKLWRWTSASASHLPVAKGRLQQKIRQKLVEEKVHRAMNSEDRFKSPQTEYTAQEAEAATICFKIMGDDLVLNDAVARSFDAACFIGLVRNGFALCEGNMRRGTTPERIGRDYHRFVSRLLAFSKHCDNFTLVRFEDMLANPAETATKLYQSCGVRPPLTGEFRLKVKTTVTGQEHTVGAEKVNTKVWVSEDDLPSFFDAGINASQIYGVSQDDGRRFLSQAAQAMTALGYTTELDGLGQDAP